MKKFHLIVFAILFVNVFFIFLKFPSSSKDYENHIETIQNGYWSYAHYDLYNTYLYKDSTGVITYMISTELAWIQSKKLDSNYYFADAFKIKNFYEHTNLGTKLVVKKSDYIKLSVLGDWIFIFYYMVYILVSILILFFIRNIKQGKMFSKRMLSSLQFLGILTLIFGYVSFDKSTVVEYILQMFCDVPVKIINQYNMMTVGNTMYILIGVFILALAFCFGRGNYLEKQNDLTI
jgi:hypothetical protein